jgi:mono/diheme cytochrome c family protein
MTMMRITNRGMAIASAIAMMVGALAVGSFLFAEEPTAKPSARKDAGSAPVVHLTDDSMRVQGEQTFRANCGRCHAAPEKFPPRMMKTVLRHMRVRATITDQDMRLVLFYMTQ